MKRIIFRTILVVLVSFGLIWSSSLVQAGWQMSEQKNISYNNLSQSVKLNEDLVKVRTTLDRKKIDTSSDDETNVCIFVEKTTGKDRETFSADDLTLLGVETMKIAIIKENAEICSITWKIKEYDPLTGYPSKIIKLKSGKDYSLEDIIKLITFKNEEETLQITETYQIIMTLLRSGTLNDSNPRPLLLGTVHLKYQEPVTIEIKGKVGIYSSEGKFLYVFPNAGNFSATVEVADNL